MRALTLTGGLGFSGLFAGLGSQIGLPWQVYLAVSLVMVISVTMVAMAQILLPQESHDKLQLWTTVIKSRARRRDGRRNGGRGVERTPARQRAPRPAATVAGTRRSD